MSLVGGKNYCIYTTFTEKFTIKSALVDISNLLVYLFLVKTHCRNNFVQLNCRI